MHLINNFLSAVNVSDFKLHLAWTPNPASASKRSSKVKASTYYAQTAYQARIQASCYYHLTQYLQRFSPILRSLDAEEELQQYDRQDDQQTCEQVPPRQSRLCNRCFKHNNLRTLLVLAVVQHVLVYEQLHV